jgi:hypothetical protein
LLGSSPEVPSGELGEVLLRMQLLMYQNKDTIEMGDELNKNTVNLMRVISWEHSCGGWSSEGDDRKYDVNFEDELSEFLEI